ncbi:MAG: adenylate/guanylate cyclase domain-containing protein [Rhodospirillaceae bacterium]|jgi:predicted ATPase/class 3 adenylate cyclase|nr:adenylate/guanylate cyclase domain-containing protein [Rhodospirillaceae bacterium]MBT3495288.1 adenylate/guanylate cyclase domain-containing protein [Rhodospirillaceae bacterium]MBT3779338.1 adenylate/guanylate cyclase domain-containing protein [Rhodospirillaceae bacterium]MBT3975692.1 adenylate/guanylate cyclase domain-containing protein [Rhodospirillaceae bacterium]MBT4167651.1 adenylate/guanylate cyclase domain-containing protein [Rhodospirillaceae bacterium]
MPLADAKPLDEDIGFQELTFLTTDIVGSAELHRRYPGDMMAAMDLHDEIVHGAIRRAGGDPFKHTGDGVLAAFEHAEDAVRAIVEAQLAMREASWGATGRLRLRTGIHFGPARPRGGDYFGPALSAVNRLEGAANADQILVSEATVERIRVRAGDAPFGFSELGEHHFKGVDRFQVYQVQAEGLPSEFAPIAGKRETANGNLPARLSSFLGREHEMNLLGRMAETSRIVTLVGPGGIGKTRAALELVRSLEPGFPGGAWFLNLASLERETDLWPVIASSLEISPVPGANRRQQVMHRLHDARTILLIDNCEHVLGEVADLVSDLCAACRELSVVATSRQVLGIDGETLYEIPPLEPPSGEDPGQSTAVRLFVERAKLVRHDFAPKDDELVTIRTICRNLDYIPLAIEIAAGQLRRFPLERIAQDSENPLNLTPSKAQRRGARQQTLRRTLEWSYDLINPASQTVLQDLSVFSSPFHEEQALEVCAAELPDEVEILDGMDELIDASLLATRVDGERRMLMLRTVQAFGRDILQEAGTLTEIEKRHGEVFAARSIARSQQFISNEQLAATSAIQDDLPNFRAAFERALPRDLDLAARLTLPLLVYTYLHRQSEIAGWPTRIMSQPGAEDLPGSPLLLAGCAAHAFHELGDTALARECIERGFALEAAGRDSSRGWLAHIAGMVAFWLRETDKFRLYHSRAITDARAHNDLACQVFDLSLATFVEARTRNGDRAHELMANLDELSQVLRQPSMIGYVHFARGGLASMDDFDLALKELRLAVEWAEIGGDHLGAQRTNRIISDIRAMLVEPREALKIEIETLIELPEHGATIYNWTAISRLIAPLAKLKADEQLAVISGALQDAPISLGSSARRFIEIARDRFGHAAFDAAAEQGKQFDQAKARTYAIDTIGSRM